MKRLSLLVAAAIMVAGCSSASGSSTPGPINQKLAFDIDQAQASVQSVQIAVGELIKSQTQANLDQVSQLADQAHTTLTNDKDQIAVDAPLNNAGADLTNADNELKNSMAALGTYTGNPNASTLASFTNQFQTGVTDWNAAVAEIYSKSSSTPPSTLGG